MHDVKKESKFARFTQKFICIDPGLNGHTGYAIFNRGNNTPLNTGTVNQLRLKTNWNYEVLHIGNNLAQIGASCQEAFIEMPEFWSGSALSYASTAQGDLFKLAYLVGALAQALHNINVVTTLLHPREWKGNMKKEMIDRRIKFIINREYPNHISDAVGIGLFVQGLI
jgi:hypothetical protein